MSCMQKFSCSTLPTPFLGTTAQRVKEAIENSGINDSYISRLISQLDTSLTQIKRIYDKEIQVHSQVS